MKSDIKSKNLRITKIKSWETVSPSTAMICSLSKPLILGFWRNAHDQYTNLLSRPLMIALQDVRTPFGFYLRACWEVVPPPPLPWSWYYMKSRHFYIEIGSNAQEQCVTRCPVSRLVHLPGRQKSVITWKISTRDPGITRAALARLLYNFCCV